MNFSFQVVLTDLPGQDMTLEILDKDMDMKDDFMGRCCIKKHYWVSVLLCSYSVVIMGLANVNVLLPD